MPMTNTIPKLIEMAQTLVAIPSVSSVIPEIDQSNLPVLEQLANWLTPLGFGVEILPISGRPGKANMIATLGKGEGGLVFSGHSDTVPFDEHLWQSNPFTLTERDDKLYGLGSCDMKAFFAVAITAMEPYLDQQLSHPLTIIATADEESSMSGARALKAAELSGARYAIIGEPTKLAPVFQHKGIMMLSLRVEGSAGHSSNPALGNNAIEATTLVIGELGKFRTELANRYQSSAFEVDVPTLNLGCIHGGDNPNRICDHVELAFDVRVLPGMDNTNIMAEIRDRLGPKLLDQGYKFSLDLFHPPVPPFKSRELSSDDTLVSAAQRLSGFDPVSVAFATEAPFLSDLGMETVVLGPGSIDQAHQPNEFLALDQLDPSIAILRGLIEKYCL
jgi:acetylornithine deacetylase